MTKALDAETEAKTEAPGFETEAEAEAVYLETEAEARGSCVRNLRNPEKFSENSSSRSSKVIDLGVSRKRICERLPVSHK